MKPIARPRTEPSVEARPIHDSDAEALDALRERGTADLVQRWTHYLFVPDADAADEAADMLLLCGWHLESAAAMPEPLPGWSLRFSRDCVLSADLLNVARARLEHVAATVEGSYSGWDARPVPAHSDDRR